MIYSQQKRKRSRVSIFSFFLAITIGVLLARADQPLPLPFKPGEKLEFEVSWGGITVGEASLEVYPEETIKGQPAHHFVLTARTTGFVNMFFKVENRIDAYTDADLTRTVYYRNRLAGKHNKNVTIDFDWVNSVIQRQDNGEKREPLAAMPGSFDPLSVFYFTRTQELKENTTYERPVTDGKKNVIGRMTVVRRETIEVGGTAYDTFLVEPETRHIGGVFKKSENPKIQIWITADDRRIPVRARSEVVVGSFLGELKASRGAI